eukprot:8886603-Alexandrium_andersonii.AAC.1
MVLRGSSPSAILADLRSSKSATRACCIVSMAAGAKAPAAAGAPPKRDGRPAPPAPPAPRGVLAPAAGAPG